MDEDKSSSFLGDFFDSTAGAAVLGIGTAWAAKELDLNHPTTTTDNPQVGALPAGQPLPAGATAMPADTINVFGLPMNKTALMIAGGALALVVVVWVAR